MTFSITLQGLASGDRGPTDADVKAAFEDLVHAIRRAAPAGASALTGTAVSGDVHLNAADVPFETGEIPEPTDLAPATTEVLPAPVESAPETSEPEAPTELAPVEPGTPAELEPTEPTVAF